MVNVFNLLICKTSVKKCLESLLKCHRVHFSITRTQSANKQELLQWSVAKCYILNLMYYKILQKLYDMKNSSAFHLFPNVWNRNVGVSVENVIAKRRINQVQVNRTPSFCLN